jgi:lysozyme family protein
MSAAAGPEQPAAALFEAALAHVLQMEGGDAEPKRVAPETVRQIFLTRYWGPARCAALPPPAALMHFDAAVDHGVGAAARMLQQAARATIDGEIGPETLAAVHAMPAQKLLERYADLRRRHYRNLPHFRRFGRDWLDRVDQTRARAAALDEAPPSSSQQPRKGDSAMTDTRNLDHPTKWWGQSLTIWGALITGMSTVLPLVGPLVGVDITRDLVHQLGDQVVGVVQAVGGLVGTVLTIYGRTRATTRLERRDLKVQF